MNTKKKPTKKRLNYEATLKQLWSPGAQSRKPPKTPRPKKRTAGVKCKSRWREVAIITNFIIEAYDDMWSKVPFDESNEVDGALIRAEDALDDLRLLMEERAAPEPRNPKRRSSK